MSTHDDTAGRGTREEFDQMVRDELLDLFECDEEFDQIEWAAGRDSAFLQHVRETYEAWEARLVANMAEDDRLWTEHEQALVAADGERDAAPEVERAEAEAQLREDMRTAFFAASPFDSDAGFEAFYPRLREARLALNARRDPIRQEIAAVDQTVPAGYRGTR
jgi:hypothetical protein